MNSLIKKILLIVLALGTIVGGIFGVTKAKEVYEGNHPVYECLYGCPSVKRRKFIRIK